jgi:hypothetical protein
MNLPDSIREFLATIGRKGGQSRSPRKIRTARRNLAKAWRVRARSKRAESRRVTPQAAETRRPKREQAETAGESWLWDTF